MIYCSSCCLTVPPHSCCYLVVVLPHMLVQLLALVHLQHLVARAA